MSSADALQSLLSISSVTRGTVSVPQKQNCPFPSYVCGGNDSPRRTQRSHLDGFLCCVFLVSSHFHGWGGGAQAVISLPAVNVCVCVTLAHADTKWASGAAGEKGGSVSGLFTAFKVHLGSSLNSFPLISFPVVAFSNANRSALFYLTDPPPPPPPPLQSSSSSSLTLP